MTQKKVLNDSEWKNYWLTRTFPFGILNALKQIIIAVVQKLQSKILGKETLPSYLIKKNLSTVLKNKKKFNIFISPLKYRYTTLPASVFGWAEKYHQNFKSFQNGDYKPSKDPEDYWTLNQFGWLFVLLLAGRLNSSLAKKYISWWVEKLGKSNTDASWRSYSISERLGNWVNIFQLFGNESLSPKIIESIRLQIKHLAKHLEEYRNNNTNNHLINNGKILYIIGRISNHDKLSNLGKTILIKEYERQMTLDGFLNEGSSHYQLLVTKNYLEALRIASLTSDKELIKNLSFRVIQMLKACSFFINVDTPEEWQIPYIGDISPDLPPALFIRKMYFWNLVNRATKNKERIFTDTDLAVPWFITGDNSDYGPLPQTKKWINYEKSGYHSWDNGIYKIWFHNRRQGLPRRHSHNDWGGFQMNIRGEPLFIDPGRSSYFNTSGLYDPRLTLAHNCLKIDDFEQAIFQKRGLFTFSYLRDGADVKIEKNDKIYINIKGYKRLKSPVSHTRIFQLDLDSVAIEDILYGKKKHSAVIAFHLHPDIQLIHHNKETFSFITQKGQKIILNLSTKGIVNVDIKKRASSNFPGGYCSNRYGFKMETISIFAFYKFNDSIKLKHKILIS